MIGTSGLYKHEDCKPIDIFNWREYMEQHDSYGEGVPQLVKSRTSLPSDNIYIYFCDTTLIAD